MSACLCPVEMLPLGLHAHGARAAISAPFRSGPSFTHYVWQWARHLSRVRLAVICGARSDLQRWSCSRCERRHELIHCVQKHNGRFNAHAHVKTNFLFPTFQTRQDSNDGCWWPAREEEDSRAWHKRRQTSWNVARGSKVVRASHRLGGTVRGWDADRGGRLTIRRAHRRSLAWLQNDQVLSKMLRTFIWSQNQAMNMIFKTNPILW